MAADDHLPGLGLGEPVAPIGIVGGAIDAVSRTSVPFVEVPDATRARLAATGAAVLDDPAVTGDAGRDWWPLAMTWAMHGEVPARASVIVRPDDVAQVSEILSLCNEDRIPVTPTAGRSGVVGGAVPLFGGVQLDLCGLAGIRSFDDESMVVDVLPGTFGDHFEDTLRRDHQVTCGHWPQSMSLSTVGGWLACRGAGQMSTRYGKVEDMVVGLDVALADGRTITTGGAPRQAVGPDLNQLFVGSEGTLGVITAARLRVHPVPTSTSRAAYMVGSFADGLDLCRRVMRRGANPAVLRLYDGIETDRNHHTGADRCAVLVLDEGDPGLVGANMAIVTEEAAVVGASDGDAAMVDHWMAKRNDVSQLEPLITGGLVIDTMEVSGPWSVLGAAYEAAVTAMREVPGCLAASAHASHSYVDGACLYFTFGAKPERDTADAKSDVHRAIWSAGQGAALAHGCSVSHHHGIGLHRGEWMARAMGQAHDVLQQVKDALDPNGILNPAKLGLRSPFGVPDLP